MNNRTKRFWLAAALMFAQGVSLMSLAQAEAPPPATEPSIREAKVPEGAFVRTPIPAWVTPAAIPDTKLTGPAIIRLFETQFQIDKAVQTFNHRALQINDSGTLSTFGQFPIEFAPAYQTVALHTLRVIRDGHFIDKRETAAVRFLQRETGLEGGVYSGVITASILMDDLRVGDVIEIAYTTTGRNPVYGDKFFGAASWAHSYPMEMRRLVVNYPSNRNIHYKRIGPNNDSLPPEPVRSTQGSNTRLSFEQRAIPAGLNEASTPAGFDVHPWLQFSEYDSWNEIAIWAESLFQFDASLNAELTQEIATLEKLPTPQARTVAALQYVQSQVRYFSIALGESSHRPSPPNLTIERRFGDCKDKSLLLATLLQKLGIKAQPVLAAVARHDNIASLLPSPMMFDHAIVRVEIDGKEYYLDPTRIAQSGKLEALGQAMTGAEVLVAAHDTQTLSVIQPSPAQQEANPSLVESMTITDFDKPAIFESRYVASGRIAEYLRIVRQRVNAEQYAKALLDEMTRRYPGAKRLVDPVIKDDLEANRLEVIERYSIDKVAEDENGMRYVKYRPASVTGALANPDSQGRKFPLAIPSFPFHGTYAFELTLPDNVSGVLDPSVHEVNNRHFHFRIAEKFRGNVSHTEVELNTLAASVAPKDLEKYEKDLQEVNKLLRGYVSISKDIIKSRGIFESAESAMIRSMRRKEEDAIAAYKKVIDGGKLTGDDLARAYLERGLSYSNLDQTDAAMADLREALKLDPLTPANHLETGTVLMKRGEYQAALERFNKALVLGEPPGRVYNQRGQLYHFMKRYAEAAVDFDRAAKDKDEASIQPYARLWYLWTMAKSGTAIAPELKAELDKHLDAGWPYPAQGLFTGSRTPQQVLDVVNRMKGDERLMTLCEAYFYIGEYYLVKGDIEKAREYFEKTLATKVIIYTEYSAAGMELQKLGKP